MTRLIPFMILLLLLGCTGNRDGNKSPDGAKAIDSDAGESMADSVVIETSMGNIQVQLDRANAQNTVDNFFKYVDSGYYNGTIFHRVIPGFMIQGGGFVSDGSQKETMAPIALENPKGNVRGTLAMARTMVPDSATSQFFINTVDNRAGLDAGRSEGYAVFGKVTSGMDIVDKIAAVKTKSNGPHQNWPAEDVMILTIRRE